MYDLVINNGVIIDPKTEVQTVGNIGILDGKISVISREDLSGIETIDAGNMVVCPGFIDIHSHLSFPLYPAWCSVRQGITTCLSGNCGLSPHMPMRKYLDDMESNGYPLNFAALVGHSWTLREMVGLSDAYQTASEQQINDMVIIAEKALEEGAFGISLGLEYAPGTTMPEIIALAKVAAKYDKLVPIHIRTDALNFAVGLREAIEISEKTGARVQISHLAYQFGVYPEVTGMALQMIGNAKAKGLPIMCDSGIYEAFATFIKSAVFDPGWTERYHCTLNDLMISSGKYVGHRCTKEIYDYVRNKEEGVVATAFVGVLPDLALALKQPYVMVSTDAGLSEEPGTGHPQDAGTYPRVFQKLVREQGVLTLMEAVKKSTWLPAQQLGLLDKGWLGSGADADIVIFDPRTIADTANYVGLGLPDSKPIGIEHVIINGVPVVSKGETMEEKLPGKILRQSNQLWRY
ncbi:MAG TPA: amidohydrolase family protein [Anaerovoracaceae bacterium]|nr:amidohydrolase family protein [Anaerovoracaceae bacterium]